MITPVLSGFIFSIPLSVPSVTSTVTRTTLNDTVFFPFDVYPNLVVSTGGGMPYRKGTIAYRSSQVAVPGNYTLKLTNIYSVTGARVDGNTGAPLKYTISLANRAFTAFE